MGGQTCYQVWGLYDYYSDGSYTHSSWEADGINCYDNGGSGEVWAEQYPIDDNGAGSEICTSLRNSVPSGCNVASPPHVTLDGCTGVPDFLVVNGTPASSIGAVFTAACNNHDRCYQTLGSDKQECDLRLEQDMIRNAMESIPSAQWSYYESHVRLQAAAYAYGLYNNVLLIPQNIFNSRQAEAACRAHSQAMILNNCLA